jgi:uncharacterized protein (DUF58 family)
MFKYKKSVIVLIISSLIFAVLGGGSLPYFVFYATTLTILLSYVWARVTVKRLDFSQRTMSEQVYVGDEVDIKTMVFNESLLPVPFVEITNCMIQEMTGRTPSSNVVTIAPFDSRSIFEKVKCRYRGFYTYGPVSVSLSDVFGLFSWKREVKCEGMLAVYPRVERLERFYIRPVQMYGAVSTKQKANEDYTSISDIRKYYPGDSFKKIHWKISARKGSLHVKNFEMSGNAEAFIFLNMFHGDYFDIYRADMEEKAVECSASIAHFMLSRNINTGMYVNCKNLVYIRGRDLNEFKKFIEELMTVKSEGYAPMEELLESRSRLLPRGSSIILVTPGLTDNLMDKIIQLRETGFDVIIVYIMVEDINAEYARVINNCGIKLYKVGLSDDIKASLEG